MLNHTEWNKFVKIIEQLWLPVNDNTFKENVLKLIKEIIPFNLAGFCYYKEYMANTTIQNGFWDQKNQSFAENLILSVRNFVTNPNSIPFFLSQEISFTVWTVI